MRIMLISKHFPPRGSALSLQAGKLATTLREAQLDLVIVAGFDKSIENTNQIEHQHFGPITHFVPYVGAINRNRVLNGLYSLWREVNETNSLSGWAKKATTTAFRVADEFKPNIIVSLANPFDSHLVGLHLYRQLKLPWLASFSDPYPPSYAPPPYSAASRTKFMSFWQAFMLKKVVRSAKGIHFHSEFTKISLENATKSTFNSFIVPHLSNCTPAQTSPQSGNGWLVHIGYLSHERVSWELLHGLKLFLDKNPGRLKGLMCVGGVSPKLLSVARRIGVIDSIKIIGKVPYEKTFEFGRSATALLLIEANMPYSAFLPSKIADYASMCRPIIAITPKISSVRNYLELFKVGMAVEHNCNDIYNAIENALIKDICIENYHDFFNEFSNKMAAKKYVQIFNELV